MGGGGGGIRKKKEGKREAMILPGKGGVDSVVLGDE